MCLATVKSTKVKKGLGKGWKVVKIPRDQETRLHKLYWDSSYNFHVPFGQWITEAKRSKHKAKNGKQYPKGFHIFLKKQR